MKKKIKDIYLFFTLYLCITLITFANTHPLYLTTYNSGDIVIVKKCLPKLGFGSWLMKKIRRPTPPLEIKGDPWLPSNFIQGQGKHRLSVTFVVQSLTNETYDKADEEKPNRNTKIPIEKLDDLLGDTTHRIYLSEITNSYLFNKLNKVFSFTYLETIKIPTVRKEIASLINRLRFSGYFSRINLSYNTYRKTAIFTLELELYPILTKVEFLNIQNLLIPAHELQELVLSQVGYPKSLTQLTLLSRKIQHWYACRGYQWVHVKGLTKSEENYQVSFQIIEGTLESITYKLCPLVNHEIAQTTEIDKFIPIKFVDQMMSLYLEKGSMPTLYNIEKAMNSLKETRFFYNFYYDVTFPWDTDKIEIIIHFVPYRDNETQLMVDKTIKKVEPQDNKEEGVQNLIDIVLQDKTHSDIRKISVKKHHLIYNYKTLATSYIYGTKALAPLSQMLLSRDIKNSLLDVEFGLDENRELYQHHSEIYFFHSMRYFSREYHFLNLTFREKDHLTQYDLSYDMPLNINQRQLYPLATRIFSNLTSVEPEDNNLFLTNLISKKQLRNASCEFRKEGIDLFFKRKFIAGSNIASTIGSRLIRYNNLKFSSKTQAFNYLKNKLKNWISQTGKLHRTPRQYKLVNQNYTVRKDLNSLIVQDFKILNFRIQFPYLDDTYHPTIGHFSQLDFLQFRPNLSLITSMDYGEGSKTTELYFLKHISYFRSRPKHSHSPYNFFFFKIFCGKLSGDKLIFSLPDRLRYQKYATKQTGWAVLKELSTSFGEYILEYHLRILKYTNPVIFIKWIQDSPLLEEYPFPHIQGELFYSKRLYLSPLSSGRYIGIAWEFRTMIAQIPPIRLEFAQQIPGRGRLYLRVIPYLY